MIVDASLYPTIGVAFGACAAGDTLYCPYNGAVYTVPSGGLVVTKPITIQGEAGTVIQSFNKAVNEPIIDIQVPAGTNLQRVRIKDVRLANAVGAGGTVFAGNYGINCVLPNTSNSLLEWLLIENVEIAGMGDTGIHLEDGAGGVGVVNTAFIFPQFRNVAVDSCSGYGWLCEMPSAAHGSTSLLVNAMFETCFANGNQMEGIRIDGFSKASLTNCYLESNCRSNTLSSTTSGQLRLRGGTYTINGVNFEDFSTTAQTVAKRALVIENSVSTTVWGAGFGNNTFDDPGDVSRCIYIFGGGGGPPQDNVVIGPARVSNATHYVEVDTNDNNCDIYLPFVQAGGTPDNILPVTMHMRSWT